MGSLTGFLQERFAASCPTGWSCKHEVDVLDAHWQRVLGYSARADVLLTRDDGSRRIWIEFEVSRADPVANHAKFATSHLFQPQPVTDTFVAMVSPHVTRGRRNLAANTILLMRRVGMSAFQTVLFPTLEPAEIKRLNHLSAIELAALSIDTASELTRAITIANPLSSTEGYQLHYAGDLLEVFCNVQRFNEELTTTHGQTLWGKRTIKYFVHDAKTGLFAPSKFCAYINAKPTTDGNPQPHPQLMSMPLYTSLDESEPKFDGNLAQTHLQRQLNMRLITPEKSPVDAEAFAAWQATQFNHIRTHPKGPLFLVAPSWFG
ncbi:MAG: hypothetical protein KDB22_01170 [Planctomycetales bacterium]|nr:hypothetical protein [Planctomycetales bacterium]